MVCAEFWLPLLYSFQPVSWNLIPLYLGGVQSATWQWFDMTRWQKTGGEDGNKDQGIQAAVLAASGESAHQFVYLLAGAQAPLMEESDDSCQGSVGLRDINLPPVVKALLVQNDSGFFACTLEFMWLNFCPHLLLLFSWYLIHLFVLSSWAFGTTLRAVTGLVDMDAKVP